jgi:anaerobic ribonucleoside-triphosphate reductase
MPISQTINGKTVTVHDSERQPVEVWSRIMGYYAERSLYNAGKVSEFNERKMYKVNEPEMLADPQQQLEL